MKRFWTYGILLLGLLEMNKVAAYSPQLIYFGETIQLPVQNKFQVSISKPLTDKAIHTFYKAAEQTDYHVYVQQILNYKEENRLDDWLYYQLVRKLAENLSPKKEDYNRYTLYKWFIMLKSGYDVTLSISNEQLLFYIQSDENVYGIPYYTKGSKHYVCLNYHDFGKIDFEKHSQQEICISDATPKRAFSYKINHIPVFKNYSIKEKQVQFEYKGNIHKLKLVINEASSEIFKNYPLVDFETYFNIPMSNDTRSSLIPDLEKHLRGFSQEEGVAFLLAFTQKAFEYKNDQEYFGKEKRMSAEQTILSDYSDCDDRVALFYYLVKEIYNVPMIAILHPTHISVGVKLDKPIGKIIEHNGIKYSYCDPTPQVQELSVGEILKKYHKAPMEVVYQFTPKR